MSPLCDVCHSAPAVVGAFCSRCSQALLDDEARRMLSLQRAGEDEAEEVKPHPVETFSWLEHHGKQLRKNITPFHLIMGGRE